jgi:hypothetical protein
MYVCMYVCVYVCIHVYMTEMPNKMITYLRMYCDINHSFSNFEETLTNFDQT